MNHPENQYHKHSGSLRSKVNRGAIASQRVRAEDKVLRALVVLIGVVLGGSVGALCMGASAIHVSWVACALVLGLAGAYSWRAHIVAELEPYARASERPPWKPTSRP